MRYWVSTRPFSHRGPGWSQSWRTGSRRPVFERWEAPQCGGLWLDTGPVSAADLCSSGTTSPRWATVAWPAANTGESQKWQNRGIWAVLWADSTGCMDAAPPKKSELERVTFTGEAKTAIASIRSIDYTVQHHKKNYKNRFEKLSRDLLQNGVIIKKILQYFTSVTCSGLRIL